MVFRMKYVFAVLFCVFFTREAVFAVERPAEELKEAGINTELGTQVDLNLSFIDASGASRTLGSLFEGNKPLVVIPAYYHCPRLCGLLLNGAVSLFSALELSLGEEYQVVTISFNPREGAALAAQRQAQYQEMLSSQGVDASAWKFLVDKDSSVKALMKSLGFHYKEDKQDFAHSAALFILTPDGRISQYFTGIEFSPWDVRLALVEASMGSIGSALDHVLLFCFRFDPLKGRYTLVAQNIMRAGGALTLIFLTGLIVTLRRREKNISPE